MQLFVDLAPGALAPSAGKHGARGEAKAWACITRGCRGSKVPPLLADLAGSAPCQDLAQRTTLGPE